jgi:hypothetical protein
MGCAWKTGFNNLCFPPGKFAGPAGPRKGVIKGSSLLLAFFSDFWYHSEKFEPGKKRDQDSTIFVIM